MGVKDFNKLIDLYGIAKVVSNFETIVIDASNLFHTYLSASYSSMKKEYGTYENGGIKLDLMTQCVYIISHTYYTVKSYITSLVNSYNPANLYLVMDPIRTPDYTIDTGKGNIDFDYLKILYPDVEFEKDSRCLIHINMKEQEQKRRKGTDNIQKELDKLNEKEEIDETVKNNPELKKCLEEITKESMMLGSQHKIIILAESLIPMLINEFQNMKNIHFVRSKGEADLFIKNLVYMSPHNNTLVLSRDTDYYFLLSDFPWCYCTDIKRGCNIYNPNQIWTNLLDDDFSYDLVIRLSPLFGNDYTTHKTIISAQKRDDVIQFLNLDGKFRSLKNKKSNTIIRKLYEVAEENEMIDDIESSKVNCYLLDEMIRIYNIDFFKLYYKSILIYSQWEFYSDYIEINNSVVKLPKTIRGIIFYDVDAYEDKEWDDLLKDSKYITDTDELNKLFTTGIEKRIKLTEDEFDEEDYY